MIKVPVLALVVLVTPSIVLYIATLYSVVLYTLYSILYTIVPERCGTKVTTRPLLGIHCM